MTLPRPWLPETANTHRLEADLKERGWRMWWHGDGSLTLTAPDGRPSRHDGGTTARTVRHAYSAAMEYANKLLKEAN